MPVRDWRIALNSQPMYRIGTRTVQFNCHHVLLLLAGSTFIIFVYLHVSGHESVNHRNDATWPQSQSDHSFNYVSAKYASNKPIINNYPYNYTYPITPPVVEKNGSIMYRIGIVADLDTKSKFVKDDGSVVWRSYLKKGYLSYTPKHQDIKLIWDNEQPIVLESSFALKGRGMELSELVTFDGRLLTFDDRTGLIYEVVDTKVIPWVIMLDGDGRSAKGFKSEWATVKDTTLYVGSMGKEWTTSSGKYENDNPMYIKKVSPRGEVISHKWAYEYKKMRVESKDIKWPGYMIHESGVWSPIHQRWFFLPRRCSNDQYNETQDEHMGCKILIIADEDFRNVKTVLLDKDQSPSTLGFSSFKFIPNSKDRIIIAIKSEELLGKTSTFITAFDIDGSILLPEQRIDTDFKYEGIEFI